MNPAKKPLVFAHIGDLHITNAKERNYTDFLSIISQLEVECTANLDFVYLPGDVADHGQVHQYKLVATALKMLSAPVYAVAGDHDMEQESLNGFYTHLAKNKMPFATTVQGVRCLFIDVNGSGKGGPDFRLGGEQLAWLENELSRLNETTAIVFMHTYPDDVKEQAEKQRLITLMEKYKVALVDMGHTHYNELANDGTTIYAATRSTGQIEEGPVGYSLISVDNGVVSWRFKPLDEGFPFVLITSPADYRLQREANANTADKATVRAIIFGDRPIKEVTCWIDDSSPTRMEKSEAGFWEANVSALAKDAVITVQAIDETGRPGQHRITIRQKPSGTASNIKTGSDSFSIGAWVENGIFGTQLGPNRNAKPL